jgi:hypothetical protein
MTLAIEDRIALQDLIANYSWALDTGDADALVACFTEDCRMMEEVFEDPDIWDGHDGIRGLMAHYANAPGFPGRQHHVTQVQYFPQEDGSCRLRGFAFVTECEGEPPYLLRFAGWYDDLAVREGDGAWRFRRRIVRLWDGAVLARFPGRGDWVARKRPESLIIRR